MVAVTGDREFRSAREAQASSETRPVLAPALAPIPHAALERLAALHGEASQNANLIFLLRSAVPAAAGLMLMGAAHLALGGGPSMAGDFFWALALFAGIAALLGLDRLRQLAARISAGEHWDRLAIRRLVDDLFAAQRVLSQSLLSGLPKSASKDAAMAALSDWAEKNKPALERTVSFLAALETSGDLSIAKLTLANSQVHKLADI